jgi:hypothetical protein
VEMEIVGEDFDPRTRAECVQEYGELGFVGGPRKSSRMAQCCDGNEESILL